MKKLLLLAVMLTAPVLASAADSFTLWANNTFSAPFTDGVLAISPTISNTSGDNSVKILVNYETVMHNGTYQNVCPCDIYATLQEEISAGVWVSVANQFESYRILDNGPQRVIIYSPSLQLNPGSDEIIQLADGTDLKVSRTQGAISDKFRVVITAREDTPGTISSITLSASGRKYTE